jgi:CRP/FNR family transcriptional regulator
MIKTNLKSSSEILDFLLSQPEAKTVNVPKKTTVAFEGVQCQSFDFLLSGKIKVFKISERGKLLTLYYINKNEGCILTTASIVNKVPIPAMAETVTDCQVLSIPAICVEKYFEESKLWRNFVFSLLTQKMAGLVDVVNDLAFHHLDERLYDWLRNNNENKVVNSTHQEIADQLASTREVISRSLKSIEKTGKVKLSRGKITLM